VHEFNDPTHEPTAFTHEAPMLQRMTSNLKYIAYNHTRMKIVIQYMSPRIHDVEPNSQCTKSSSTIVRQAYQSVHEVQHSVQQASQ
jgi:hypothetical protein